MAEFYKTSATWVVDFRYDGRDRRWFKAFRPGDNPEELMRTALRELYEARATLVGVRLATPEEERSYHRGEEPRNAMCPIDPAARSLPRSPVSSKK